MIGEINIDGVFISPLLLCLVCAFFLRMALSWVLNKAGVYSLVVQRPLFDTALFLILAGLFFHVLKLLTTP
jgi:hypothetical protein